MTIAPYDIITYALDRTLLVIACGPFAPSSETGRDCTIYDGTFKRSETVRIIARQRSATSLYAIPDYRCILQDE
jgi:hypothetical protein